MTIIGAACYPLARSIRFPCRPARPAILPPHYLIALPPRSLDTGDGAGASCSRLLDCAARSLLPFRFCLRSICAGSVEDGVGWLPCLLGYRIMYLVDGGRDKRDGACPAFDCLDAPAHPLSSLCPPLRRISGPGFFSSSFHCPDSLPLFFRRPRPVRLINHGGRVEVFLCVLCAAS